MILLAAKSEVEQDDSFQGFVKTIKQAVINQGHNTNVQVRKQTEKFNLIEKNQN